MTRSRTAESGHTDSILNRLDELSVIITASRQLHKRFLREHETRA